MTDQRELAEEGPNWNADTLVELGAKSWDIDFNRKGGHAPYKTVTTKGASLSDPSNVVLTWAGDSSSSLMMFSDSTSRTGSLKGKTYDIPVIGLVASEYEKSAAVGWYYSEIDWKQLTDDKLIAGPSTAGSPSPPAIFSLHEMPQVLGSSNILEGAPDWPWEDADKGGKVTLYAHPQFRIYDHGVCGAQINWKGYNKGIPSVNALIQSQKYSFPKQGELVEIEALAWLGLRAYAELDQVEIDLYPHFAPSPAQAGYSATRTPDDSIILIGTASGQGEASLGFIPATGTFRALINVEVGVGDIAPAEVYPNRIPLNLVRDTISVNVDGKWLGEPFVIVVDELKPLIVDKFDDTVSTFVGTLQYRLNALATPFMPTANELIRWVTQRCNPTVPAIGSPVSDGGPFCIRRKWPQTTGEETDSTAVHDGAQEAKAWATAFTGGDVPPMAALTNADRFGPWPDDDASNFPLFDDPKDASYRGCLGQDLRVKANECGGWAAEYRDALLRLATLNTQLSVPQVNSLKELAADLSPDDFECRPLDGSSAYTVTDQTAYDPLARWPCQDANGNLDDAKAPYCEHVPIWNDKSSQKFGSPPDSVQCVSNNKDRALPRKSESDCAALESACANVSTIDVACADLFLFCRSREEYCSTEMYSPMEILCADQYDEPRCYERDIYCNFGDFCASSQVTDYCASQGLGSTLQVGPDPCNPDSGGPFSGTDDPGPFDQAGDSPFRKDIAIACDVCVNKHPKCYCSTNADTTVHDHWCSLRIPVQRVNISPTGIEVVFEDGVSGHRTRWERIIGGLETIARTSSSSANDLLPALCNPESDVVDPDHPRRRFYGAGNLPKLQVEHLLVE